MEIRSRKWIQNTNPVWRWVGGGGSSRPRWDHCVSSLPSQPHHHTQCSSTYYTVFHCHLLQSIPVFSASNPTQFATFLQCKKLLSILLIFYIPLHYTRLCHRLSVFLKWETQIIAISFRWNDQCVQCKSQMGAVHTVQCSGRRFSF